MKQLFTFASLMILTAPASHAAAREINVSPGSCDAINQALASLDQHIGGIVRLAAGEYKCETPIVIKTDNVRLLGAGSDKTFVKAADGKALPVIVIGDVEPVPMQTPKWGEQFYPKRAVKNIEVAGIAEDGNRHSTPFSFQQDRECYDFDKMTSLNCSAAANKLVRNNGITVRRASNVHIHDVITDRNYSGGIVTEKKCDHILADHFYSHDNFFDGFAGYETRDSLFRDCSINHNTYSAVSVDLGFEYNTFKNCDISHNGDNAIFSANVGHNTYDGLTMKGNKNYCIYLDGTSFQREDGSWLKLPSTCDGNVVKNSICDASPDKRSNGETEPEKAGKGIRVDGLCAKTEMTSLQITAKADCKFFTEGSEVSENSVLCLDKTASPAAH